MHKDAKDTYFSQSKHIFVVLYNISVCDQVSCMYYRSKLTITKLIILGVVLVSTEVLKLW